ncbi:secretion/conjugation apparatus DotM-related subunit [Paraburkholderia sediminicola]|uniref:secretion/conjugation apparatus DotM-related subunit n=1 Tax=Paraburkholderia sediminicola TaxID=458836 RepID=UPI0038BB30BE
MKSPSAQPSTAKENELLWICGMLFVGGIVFWFMGHTAIAKFVMRVRFVEAKLLFIDPDAREAIAGWLLSRAPEEVTFGELWRSGMVAGSSLRWVVMVIVVAMFGYLIYRSPDRSGRYTKKYTPASLIKQESAVWPMLMPVVGQNLIDVSLDDPVRGMRQRPRDYLRRVGALVSIAGLPDDLDPATFIEIDHRNALRLDRLRAALGAQLGPMWEGVRSLRGYEKCLFAAFAAQMANDLPLARSIVNDLAVSYVKARTEKRALLINSVRAQKALHDYGNSEQVKRICGRHAFKRLVFISMFDAAKANGVFPSAWFGWLKTVDRTTWYALNDLGLDVASAEASGIRAQWLAEKMAKTAITNPMIDPAIDGLKSYLEELIDDQEDD